MNNNNGFTLLEIMIVLSILGILMVVVSPNLNSSKGDFNLQANAKECVANLRYAQQLSIDTIEPHGIYFDDDMCGYKLKKESGEVIKTIKFSGGIEYQSIQGYGGSEIVFDKNGKPYNSGKIDLKINRNDVHVYIIVTSNTGEVRVSWN